MLKPLVILLSTLFFTLSIATGGGTTGLVVAARLTEDPHVTVAVIEAGVYYAEEPLVNTPELFGQAIGNPAFDWNFFTVPQTGLNNATLLYPRGRMLGGSSGLNFMAWDRGSVKEYDAWEKLGATGWSWKTLLPYFKKTEAVSPQASWQLFPGSSKVSESTFNVYHGRSGPIQSSYNVIYTNITAPYVETVNGLGIPTNSDPYMGDGTGVYNCEMTIDRVKDLGKRSYAANTYYNSSNSTPNLTLFLGTQATRIKFSKDSQGQLRAASVNVVAVNSTGITGTIVAHKEVILAAGSIQTPQLLELSGIGNKAVLDSVGIKTLVDLPGVGENLQDHTLLAQDFEILGTFFTYDELRNNATYLAEQQAEYANDSTGIFASAQFALTFPPIKSIVSKEVLATMRSSAEKLLKSPGLSALTKAQYEFQADWLTHDDVAYLEYIMLPTGGRTPVSPTPNSVYITIWVGIMHPFSRGAVHINSSDPLKQPTIDPRYLNNDVDLQIALASTKFARKITESEPLASFVVGPHEPAGNMTTDADWFQFIKTNLGTIYHPMGTAAMLPREIGGVVDPKSLKVYGTSNLRVVDASVIPLILATHPVSTIYAIAERAADMIKGRV
ncbi:alcohol oxidase [Daedaleopsis nitida]|nr:alcohol oxidase [Daedaleopsis nitida]